MCPYMVTSVLEDQQYMFGVISLFVDEKVLLMKKDLADEFSTTDAVITEVKSLILYDMTGVCQ